MEHQRAASSHANGASIKVPPDKNGGIDTGPDVMMGGTDETTTPGGAIPDMMGGMRNPKKSFLQVVQGRTEDFGEQQKIDPTPIVDGEFEVEIDIDAVKRSEKKWGHCLVGYFKGVSFKPHILQLRLSGIWRTRAAFHVVPLDCDHYLFRFDDNEDLMGALLGGPWFVGHHRLCLQSWNIDFNPATDKISNAPVWIRLQNLPLKFWETDSLLKIAAAVGKPLKMDKFTATRQSGRFARLCVEVDLEKPLTRGVRLKSPSGSQWQNIIYEDLPMVCSYCRFAGHTISVCKRKAEETVVDAAVESNLGAALSGDRPSELRKADDWTVAVRTRKRNKRVQVENGRRPPDSGNNAGEKIRKDEPVNVQSMLLGDNLAHVLTSGTNSKKSTNGRTPVVVEAQDGIGRGSNVDGSHPGNRFQSLEVEDNSYVEIDTRKESITGVIKLHDSPSTATEFNKLQLDTISLPPNMRDPGPVGIFLNGPRPKPVGPNLVDQSFAFGVDHIPATEVQPGYGFDSQLSSQLVLTADVPSFTSSEAGFVVDITPTREEDAAEFGSQELVVFEASNDSRKAKDLRLDRMEFCRLTGNKTKGTSETESHLNSHEKGSYQKANKLAKTRFTR